MSQQDLQHLETSRRIIITKTVEDTIMWVPTVFTFVRAYATITIISQSAGKAID
jgi:hypothetical protein